MNLSKFASTLYRLATADEMGIPLFIRGCRRTAEGTVVYGRIGKYGHPRFRLDLNVDLWMTSSRPTTIVLLDRSHPWIQALRISKRAPGYLATQPGPAPSNG